MTEIVPITRSENLPAVFDREADRTIPDRVLAWVGSDGVAELRRPLTAAERQIVERRVGLLRRVLAPSPKAERNRLEGEMSLMLGGFTVMQKIAEVAARDLVAQYLQLSRDQPFWAIVEACRMVRSGKAGLPVQYCPNELEFNTIIRRLVSDYERRLIAAQRLLDARVQPPPAPKLTREEIEAKLGRAFGARASSEPQAPPVSPGDGRHAERVLADLAARQDRCATAATAAVAETEI